MVVGVRYDNGLSPNGDRDAKAFADALVKNAGFEYDHVFRLYRCSERDQLPPQAIGRQPQEPCKDYASPTHNQVLETLWNIKHNLPPDGLFVVFFAGHGRETRDTDVLYTVDFPKSSDEDSLTERTTLNLNDIKEVIWESGVRQVIIFLDACRVGAQRGSGALTEGFVEKIKHLKADIGTVDAFVVMFATTTNEKAFEDDRVGMGNFTEALVEGISGGAADEQGMITLSGLKNYVERIVPERAKRESHEQQVPSAYIDGYDAEKLVVARRVQESSTATVPSNVTVLNFDEVDTSGPQAEVPAAPYLARFGITLEAVTPGTQVVVRRNDSMYGGLVLFPPSPPNMLYQDGTKNDPASFTLRFAKPLRSVTFTRPELLVNMHGITFPEWSARAFNAKGDEFPQVGEKPFGNYRPVPAKTFTLRGKDIVRVQFDSNNHHFAAFETVVLDDLILDPED